MDHIKIADAAGERGIHDIRIGAFRRMWWLIFIIARPPPLLQFLHTAHEVFRMILHCQEFFLHGIKKVFVRRSGIVLREEADQICGEIRAQFTGIIGEDIF